MIAVLLSQKLRHNFLHSHHLESAMVHHHWVLSRAEIEEFFFFYPLTIKVGEFTANFDTSGTAYINMKRNTEIAEWTFPKKFFTISKY